MNKHILQNLKYLKLTSQSHIHKRVEGGFFHRRITAEGVAVPILGKWEWTTDHLKD